MSFINDREFPPAATMDLPENEKQAVLKTLEVAVHLFHRDGGCKPVLLGPLVGFGTAADTNSDEGKEITGQMMTQLSKQTLTVFIGEAWTTSPKRKPADGKFLRPSKDPEKVEAIMVRVITDKGKRDLLIACEIVRKPDKKPTLTPWVIMADTKDDGSEVQHPTWKEDEEE